LDAFWHTPPQQTFLSLHFDSFWSLLRLLSSLAKGRCVAKVKTLELQRRRCEPLPHEGGIAAQAVQ
jgi:hypothetical protein